jgi:hypothetical protein
MSWLERAFLAEGWWIFLCVLLGAAQSWICRYTMISDGISYLDIGDAYFRRDWAAAINAYWSPLYSWLLGFGLYLLKPSIWWEFVVVHLVNFSIYVGALFSFRFLMHAVLRLLRETRSLQSTLGVPLPEDALLALGYSLFLWCGLIMADVGRVIPDLLVAGILFLIAGCLVETGARASYGKYALFGLLSGSAYLGKAIMFPLGFGLLAILLFSGKLTKHRVAGVLLALGTFLTVCSPFIYSLSKSKGRFTAGDTGKLVYSALVYPGKEQAHWQGEPAGSGIPLHTTRKLMDDPPVFEFAEPIRGTYPPWDDPSYWNDGTRWNFHLRSQLRVLLQSSLSYQRLLVEELGLLCGAVIFLLLGGAPTRRALAANWPLLAAAGLSLAAYSFVLVIPRYVGGSIAVLYFAVFASIRLPNDDLLARISRLVAVAVSMTVLISVIGHISDSAYTQLTVGAEPSGRDQITTALGLEDMGLRAGDRVSVIGVGSLNHWARLGRFKIVAESAVAGLPARDFWAATEEHREQAYHLLKSTGAKVVVAWDPPQTILKDKRWKQISGTGYYAYFFPQ